MITHMETVGAFTRIFAYAFDEGPIKVKSISLE